MSNTIATQQSGFDPCRKLREHINDQQVMACRLQSILEAIETLDNNNLAPNAVTALIHVALDMARDLNGNLDSAALPKS